MLIVEAMSALDDTRQAIAQLRGEYASRGMEAPAELLVLYRLSITLSTIFDYVGKSDYTLAGLVLAMQEEMTRCLASVGRYTQQMKAIGTN